MANYDYEQYKQRIQDLLASDPEPKVPANLDEVVNQLDDIEWSIVEQLGKPLDLQEVRDRIKANKDHQPNQ